MPKPDFDPIAEHLIAATILRLTIDNDHPQWNDHMRTIVAQFRQVWNARGAADAELRTAVETVLAQFTTDEAQGYRSRDRQYVIELLGRALKAARDR